MAARLNRMHQESVREKIKVSQLINRLANHALGKNKMTNTQVRAAEILLNKSLPNLQSSELTGPNGGPVQTESKIDFSKATAEQLRAIAALAVDPE